MDVKTKLRGRAIVKGGKGTATRTMGLLGAILGYAVEEGYRPDNPTRGIARPAYRKRTTRIDDDQYHLLGELLKKAENAEHWQAILAIRLIALTGCRRGEVVSLGIKEVDEKAQLLKLGDTKTGASVRPIGKAALAVVQHARKRASDAHVFPGVRSGNVPFGGLPKAWKRIVVPALPGVTPHTLRHSFASVADDLGYSEATIGAMLGHAGGGTTRGYIHKLDPALIAAADRVAGVIAEMMTGESNKVVDITRASA